MNHQIDNFLNDKNLLQAFFNEFILDGKIHLSYTNRAHTTDQVPHGFGTSLDTYKFDLPVISHLYKKISLFLSNSGKDLYIRNWHLNVHPSGYDGTIHTDYVGENLPTFLYCVTPGWLPEWGGEFIGYNEKFEAVSVNSFKEDRLIIFDGGLPHRSVAPTRLSTLLRATLAFQCGKKDEK